MKKINRKLKANFSTRTRKGNKHSEAIMEILEAEGEVDVSTTEDAGVEGHTEKLICLGSPVSDVIRMDTSLRIVQTDFLSYKKLMRLKMMIHMKQMAY